MIIQWIRFIIGAIFILVGMAALFTVTFGLFRFKYVLNRMHVAAKCDTLGVFLTFIGLVIMNGLTFTTAKLILIIAFIWVANPVSSHLIAHLEVATNPKIQEECEVIRHDGDNMD